MKFTKTAAAVVGVATGLIWLAACSTDADVVSENISKAADQFEVNRRIVFINGITDKYLLEVVGACNIVDQSTQLEVTCKVGDGQYKKHFLGKSDNVTYVVEQVDSSAADANHYRVIFKPETIIPDIDRP